MTVKLEKNRRFSTCHLVIHALVVGSISRVGVAYTSRRLQVNHIGLCIFQQQQQQQIQNRGTVDIESRQYNQMR